MVEVKVYMLAFCNPGTIRIVTVPDREFGPTVDDKLDAVFHWGQNDFQPLPVPSVSVGDVIELPDGDRWAVDPVGFRLLETEEEFEECKNAILKKIRGWSGR